MVADLDPQAEAAARTLGATDWAIKGQPNKDESDEDAQLCERDLNAQRLKKLPEPTRVAVKRRQGNPGGDRGRQRERQIDERIDQPSPWKFITGEHPSQ